MTKTTQLGIRLEPEQLDLLDELVTAFTARHRVDANRSSIARAAMLLGFEQMKAELLPKPGARAPRPDADAHARARRRRGGG